MRAQCRNRSAPCYSRAVEIMLPKGVTREVIDGAVRLAAGRAAFV